MSLCKIDKLSVLVVEDMQPLSNLIEVVLNMLGAGRVIKASNGDQGFDLFCNHNPDIVFTDWHMPKVSGVELLQKIRTSDHSPNKMVPVVMVTGFNAPDRISLCRDNGVTEYLVKPFTAEDIAKRVSHVIKNPRDFIDSQHYFGPDRRRRAVGDFVGGEKRRTNTAAR